MADCTHNPPCPGFPAHRARQIADWKTAQAKHNRQLRNRRGKRPAAGYTAGMNVIRRIANDLAGVFTDDFDEEE